MEENDLEEVTSEGSTPSPRGFLLVAGQQLVGTVLGFIVWVMLARMLPVDDFGEFNAAFGVAMMLGRKGCSGCKPRTVSNSSSNTSGSRPPPPRRVAPTQPSRGAPSPCPGSLSCRRNPGERFFNYYNVIMN